MEALEDIPKIEGPLLTEKGEAVLQKTDIFRKIMWFGFNQENNWFPLNIERVNHILRMNREGKRPASLDIDEVEEKITNEPLNSDLDKMDKKFKSKSKKKKKKRPQGNAPGNQGQDVRGQKPENRNQGQDNRGPKPENRNKQDNRNQRSDNRNPRQDNRPPRNENRGPKPGEKK
jgi:hypothetical protein